jgi:hypothetical protein
MASISVAIKFPGATAPLSPNQQKQTESCPPLESLGGVVQRDHPCTSARQLARTGCSLLRSCKRNNEQALHGICGSVMYSVLTS